jgi:hypothetical protein
VVVAFLTRRLFGRTLCFLTPVAQSRVIQLLARPRSDKSTEGTWYPYCDRD